MINPTTVSMIRDIVAIFGVIAGFSYYVLTVQNTKKAREAQIFLQLSNRMADPKWMNGLQEIQNMNFDNYHDFKSFYDKEENSEKWENIWVFLSMGDDLGGMVKGGYIGIRIIAFTSMSVFISSWEKLELIIDGWREYANNPRVCNGNEYIYDQLIKFKKTHPNL